MYIAHGAACIYTCTSNPPSSGIAAHVSKTYPNTKVIDYPYSISSEQDTLTLIDEALNAWGRLDVRVRSSGPPFVEATTPAGLQKCLKANSMAPFFALKYAPPAIAKRPVRATIQTLRQRTKDMAVLSS